MLLRTAKSCGPDAPTLASSLAEVLSALPGSDKTLIREMTVAKEPGHRGEPDISRKTIACGNAGRSGVLVVTRVRSINTKCTRGRGCSGHAAFPTPSRGREIFAELGRIAPRDREVPSGVALLLDIFEVGMCAKRYLASRHKTHPSCPDLIRASINLRKKFLRGRWITGSSPVTTV